MAERVRAVVAAAHERPAGDPDGDRDGVADGVTDGPGHGDGTGGRAGRSGVRLDPGQRPVVALGLVVVVVAVIVGVWLFVSRPQAEPVDAAAGLASASVLAPSSPGGSSGSPGGSPPASGARSGGVASPSVVVVDVAGKVRRPGVYRLPVGSRVDDALTAAGGALPRVDLSSLNLAALLVDGQQVAVGRPGAAAAGGVPAGNAPPGSGGGSGAGGGATGLVNLNTATLEQLEALPGIGPALGQRILDYRTEHGSFASVDQLDDVSGIGTVTFERLKPLVTV